MKVYEALAQALVSEGIGIVFTVMDEINMHLVLHLSDKFGVKVIRARHEEGAVLMADGYTRVTGQPAVAIIGAGPAIAHTGTGLVTMRLRRSPVIVIAADVARTDPHNAKAFDNCGYTEVTAGTFIPLQNASTLVEDVGKSFRHVRSGKGPVVLNVPGDVFQSTVEEDWQYLPAPNAESILKQRIQPDPDVISQAAARLSKAERPVIIAGRGAVMSGARDSILELGGRVGALFACSLQARGFLDPEDYFLGISGGFATPTAVKLIKESDCVLSVGTSLNAYTTRHGTLCPSASLIQIDSEPSNIGALIRPDIGIVGDALAVVSALNSRLEKDGISGRVGYRSDSVRESVTNSWSFKSGPYVESKDLLDPHELVAELNTIVPELRTVVCEAGHFCLFAAIGMDVPDSEGFIFGNDFAAMSVGLGLSIGAALGRPDRRCILFIGDGGMMMSLPELETAARYNIPLTVIVMNDGAYGAEFHKLKAAGKSIDLTLFDNPEFEDVARSLGCKGATARTIAEVRAACASIGNLDGPLVIDAKVTRDVMHWAMKEFL